MEVLVRQARDQWESAETGNTAADLTATLVAQELRLHSDESLEDRARAWLDSVGFSAEVAADKQLLALNFFPPASAAGESWLYLYRRDSRSVEHQPLEGGGMRLLDLVAVTTEPSSNSSEAPTEQAAILLARQSPSGPQPLAYVWVRASKGRWRLAQSLGPDSLGGVGTARFARLAGEGVALESRTFRPTPGFQECPTCPHLYRKHRFRWAEDGFVSAGVEIEPSSYQAFVELIQALTSMNRDRASELVTDPFLVDAAIRYEWDRAKGPWRLAPGTEGNAPELVFFRGSNEAFRVQFEQRGREYRISGFESTNRNIE